MKKLLLTLLMLVGVYGAFAQVLPCNLAFSLSTPPGTSQTVTLTNNSTFNTGWQFVNNVSINWGDNSTSSIPPFQGYSSTHTYSAPGTYTVTLTGTTLDSATQAVLCSSSTSQQTTVTTLPCATSISQVNNGSGSYTFTANNLGGGTGIVYSWNFGDGSPIVTGASVTHTYAFSGAYTVNVTAVSSNCQFSTNTTVQYLNGSLNCNQLTASFNVSSSGYNVMFNNTSSWLNVPGMNITRSANWDFGDGSTATQSWGNVSHTYTTAGTYTVTLVNNWVDSFNNVVYCTKSTSQTVVISTPPPASNLIQGAISWDSLSTNGAPVTFRVWLIHHDATANTLTAIDSTTVSGASFAYYTFNGYAPGLYRTKAAALSGSPAISNMLPTYSDSSLYWNSAIVINHTGATSNANIYIRSGISTGGPGFIGGNIFQGANKGTGGGVPGLLVTLLNSSNQVIAFTHTDANGDYSFPSVAYGTYIVFPESMNYFTTPSSSLTISSSQPSITGVHFKHTSTDIKPVPTGVEDVPGSSLFNIYPNPAKENLQINWKASMNGDATVSIVDITGREVMSKEVKMTESTKVDLSGLQEGMYMIKVRAGDMQHVEKVILQH